MKRSPLAVCLATVLVACSLTLLPGPARAWIHPSGIVILGPEPDFARSVSETAAALDPARRERLEMIIGDQIGPQPEGVVVISSFPDPPHDRVILEVDRIVDQHLHRIAEKYGAKSIAVRVSMDDGGSPAGLAVGSAPVTPTPARP